eukprot:m.110457 g.110457  ORF g.110457 m.110457 type:complete len:94 (+) comp9340_c0_seq3:2136-2417(+)
MRAGALWIDHFDFLSSKVSACNVGPALLVCFVHLCLFSSQPVDPPEAFALSEDYSVSSICFPPPPTLLSWSVASRCHCVEQRVTIAAKLLPSG